MKWSELIAKIAGFMGQANGDVDIKLVIEDHDGFQSLNQRDGVASFALYGGYDGEPVRIVSRRNLPPPEPVAPREFKKCPYCTDGYDPFSDDDGRCTWCDGAGNVRV